MAGTAEGLAHLCLQVSVDEAHALGVLEDELLQPGRCEDADAVTFCRQLIAELDRFGHDLQDLAGNRLARAHLDFGALECVQQRGRRGERRLAEGKAVEGLRQRIAAGKARRADAPLLS